MNKSMMIVVFVLSIAIEEMWNPMKAMQKSLSVKRIRP